MGVPGAIVKDVGLFLKWIHGVPEEEVRESEQRRANMPAAATVEGQS